MGRMVIVAYRPKPGRDSDLHRLCEEHLPMLRAERLVTDRPGVQMKAGDGTFVEVFEWASAEAIERAHHNDAVQKLWTRFAEVCDHIPAAEVPEASKLFSEFSALPAV